MPLPRPADMTSLVLRTDFTDPEAWHALGRAVDAADEYLTATFVSDRRFDGVTLPALIDEDARAGDDEKVLEVFLADRAALSDPAFPLLAVDLSTRPGRTFRVPAERFPALSANLSSANLSFAECADATDEALPSDPSA